MKFGRTLGKKFMSHFLLLYINGGQELFVASFAKYFVMSTASHTSSNIYFDLTTFFSVTIPNFNITSILL
jgi:hypothetical protein